MLKSRHTRENKSKLKQQSNSIGECYYPNWLDTVEDSIAELRFWRKFPISITNDQNKTQNE